MLNELSPRDRLFRLTMEKPQAAKCFFQDHLPEFIKSKISLDTLQLENNTFVEAEFREHMVDALFSVSFDEANGKDKGYLYVLCEHQNEPDKMLPLLVSQYVLKIMEHHLCVTNSDKLPVVYPIIFHTGQRSCDFSTDQNVGIN